MSGLESVNLSFSYGAVWFIIALLLSAGYTYYVYRYTVPPVRPLTKSLLITLRSLALLLLLFFIFEPVLKLTMKSIQQPVHLFFIDDSRSIRVNDGTGRIENMNRIIGEISDSEIKDQIQFYKFGSGVEELSSDSLLALSFQSGATNFSGILKSVKENQSNIASVSIISDGIVTAGSTPFSEAERLNIPLFTIGLGDTSAKKDVRVVNTLYNEYLYAGTSTIILAEIGSRGYAGREASISFYEDDKPLEQQNIIISEEGYQTVSFNYKPESGGEKKITVSISVLEGENNTTNNKQVFYVNVLDNKLNVLLVSGAPSQDLAFIKGSLNLDENINVKTITVLNQNRILEKTDITAAVDSADILFLLGFPASNSPVQLNQKVAEAVNNRNKPYFFLLQSSTDYGKLGLLQSSLSFNVKQNPGRANQVQPYINSREKENPLLQNNAQNIVDAWNSLPPVYQPAHEFTAKPGSQTVAEVKVNNVPLNRPLIITRRIGSGRSISLLAFDVWKWKLQTAAKNMNLFDSFILNSVKWLNTENDRKQVSIRTSKKLYARGEEVEFTAQVYDEAFNPVSGAEVKVNINGPDKSEILLNSLGSGLYEGSFTTGNIGDYTYSGTAASSEKTIGRDNGRFNIGEVDIEMIEDRADFEFLNTLAKTAGGEFYPSEKSIEVIDRLKRINEYASKEMFTTTEMNLWANEWMMAILVFVLAAEWFIRKRTGML